MVIENIRGFAIALILILLSVTGATAGTGKEIMVSAASDLTRAFKEMGEMYEKETGYKVLFNFGSSGILAQQIEGGAPVDLFASASRSYIDKLDKKGLVLPETKRVYAVGRIALVVPKGGAKLDSLNDLLRPGTKKIAIANPSHAPYGMAAKEAMENTGTWDKVKDRIVYGENIRQTLQYVETGDVDAAVVALALCIASDIDYALIPQALHSPIEQSMAVIKGAKNERAAKEFEEYITGPKGKAILERYGFKTTERQR